MAIKRVAAALAILGGALAVLGGLIAASIVVLAGNRAPGPPSSAPGTVGRAAINPAPSSHAPAPKPSAGPSTAQPLASPSPPPAVMPDGVPAAQVGALRLNYSATDIWNTWNHTLLMGAGCSSAGTVALTSSVLDLTTNGQLGDCAGITSRLRYGFGIYEALFWVQAGPSGTIANWPAFWMVGPDWPVDGEIDAFEGLSGYDSATFHYGAHNTQLTEQDKALKPGWNVVDVVWAPRQLTVYYNGREFVAWKSSVITSRPMWIRFDMTTGAGGYTTGQPSTMYVQYLRIWSLG